MSVFSLTVSYDGSPFCGFARQPEQPTVQGELEGAFQMIFGHPVETVCAGRTDTGVHALGQVISFELSDEDFARRGLGIQNDTPDAKALHATERSLNALTDDKIAVRDLQLRDVGFSARFSALSREYRYFICTSEQPPIFTRGFTWHVPQPLDIGAMREAAAYLIGEHDFKSFCLAASAIDKPTCRNVMEVDITCDAVMGEPLMCIKVIGNAFLHSMIRAIVGTLVCVGRGKRSPEWVQDVLAACDRRAAGENAPANGLVFWHVDY